MVTSCSPSWGHRRREKIVLIKSTKTQHKEILLCCKGYQKYRGKKVSGLDLKIPTLPGNVARKYLLKWIGYKESEQNNLSKYLLFLINCETVGSEEWEGVGRGSLTPHQWPFLWGVLTSLCTFFHLYLKQHCPHRLQFLQPTRVEQVPPLVNKLLTKRQRCGLRDKFV